MGTFKGDRKSFERKSEKNLAESRRTSWEMNDRWAILRCKEKGAQRGLKVPRDNFALSRSRIRACTEKYRRRKEQRTTRRPAEMITVLLWPPVPFVPSAGINCETSGSPIGFTETADEPAEQIFLRLCFPTRPLFRE